MDFFRLIWSVALLNLALASYSHADNKPPLRELFSITDRPIKIICFGDSVTGLYYHTGGRRTYTDMLRIGLERTFPQATIEAMNPGMSGGTAEQGLERIQKDVLDHEPALVTIMFSLNDMVRAESLEAFEADLLEIIQQCHAIDAAVLLCTPNSVIETPDRPIARLETFVETIRNMGKKHHLPVADCYAAFEAVRNRSELAWLMLLSDEIHPNMAGHKLIAETIVEEITGQHISLADVPTPQPAIPFTLARLRAGETVSILAMPPYDAIVPETIQQQFPNADLKATQWKVDNLSLAEIQTSADQVREGRYNLVVIALPWESCPGQDQRQLLEFSSVLNKSLTYGQLEWDCIAIAPSVDRPAESEQEKLLDSMTGELILNKDIALVDRNDALPNVTSRHIFSKWWASQYGP